VPVLVPALDPALVHVRVGVDLLVVLVLVVVLGVLVLVGGVSVLVGLFAVRVLEVPVDCILAVPVLGHGLLPWIVACEKDRFIVDAGPQRPTG
jgi:hypothetical protein